MGIEGLQFQVVPIAFTQGLDTRTQQKLVLPGKWLELTNYTLSDDFSPKLRDGWEALAPSALANGLVLHDDQLLALFGSELYSVTLGTPLGDQVVQASGRYGFVGVEKTEVLGGTGSQDQLDMAVGNGLTCYVWRARVTSGGVGGVSGINVSVVDSTTGAQLINNQQVAASTSPARCPRVVFADDAFFIFWADNSQLYCSVIDTSSPTVVGSATSIVAANVTTRAVDACVFDDLPLVVFSYNDGATSVFAAQVTRAGTTPSLGANSSVVNEADVNQVDVDAVCCAPFPSGLEAGIFVHAHTGGLMSGLVGVVIDTAITPTVGATVLDATVAANNSFAHVTAAPISNDLWVFRDFMSQLNTDNFVPIRDVRVDSLLNVTGGPSDLIGSSTYGVGTTARGPQGPFISGKAFASGGNIFLPVCMFDGYFNVAANNNQQNCFFLLQVLSATSAVVVAKALYGSYGNMVATSTTDIGPVCSAPASGSSVLLACTEKTRLQLANGGIDVSPTGVVQLSLTPNATTGPVRAQLGELTLMAGGSITQFDGNQAVEFGFPLFPEGLGATAAGGGGMTAGTHQIVAIYEWTDNAGNRHQSAPSLPVSVTVAGGDQVAIQIPTLLISQRTGVNVIPYVTLAGGTTFYRAMQNGAVNYVPLANVTNANDVTFALVESDAQLSANEVLYNQPTQAGSTLANIAPGPCRALAAIQNRLWYDFSDFEGQFGYSQELINGVGLQTSPDLRDSVPSGGGDIRAFAALDEKVIIMLERRIFVVYGNGPTPSGGFNNYSAPQEIPSDVGCSEPRSVVRIPDGLIFKSEKGWYLLGRDLSVNYIGDGAAAYDANDVTSATLLGDQQEVRFTSSSGTHLIYSHLNRQWSVATINSATPYAIADAVWWPTTGLWTHVSLADGLNQDNPGSQQDQVGARSALGIKTRAKTGFLHLSQLEGFQRVRWLYLSMTSASAPVSTLNVYVDFDDANGGTLVGPAPGAYGFTADLATRFAGYAAGLSIDIRSKLRRQKCKSISFTFEEFPQSPGSVRTTGIQAIALQVGVKKGVNRLPAAQSVG